MSKTTAKTFKFEHANNLRGQQDLNCAPFASIPICVQVQLFNSVRLVVSEPLADNVLAT